MVPLRGATSWSGGTATPPNAKIGCRGCTQIVKTSLIFVAAQLICGVSEARQSRWRGVTDARRPRPKILAGPTLRSVIDNARSGGVFRQISRLLSLPAQGRPREFIGVRFCRCYVRSLNGAIQFTQRYRTQECITQCTSDRRTPQRIRLKLENCPPKAGMKVRPRSWAAMVGAAVGLASLEARIRSATQYRQVDRTSAALGAGWPACACDFDADRRGAQAKPPARPGLDSRGRRRGAAASAGRPARRGG
jgi:hypothetical protein